MFIKDFVKLCDDAGLVRDCVNVSGVEGVRDGTYCSWENNNTYSSVTIDDSSVRFIRLILCYDLDDNSVLLIGRRVFGLADISEITFS